MSRLIFYRINCRLMNSLHVGDIVQNPTQTATIRWLGSIEDNAIIGLQLNNSTLPGYTDGTCPYDNKRYFLCPPDQGYYVLESSFINSYRLIQRHTDNDYNSIEQTLSTSPVHAPLLTQPIPSTTSPSVSQIQFLSDNNHVTSSPRGVLSRLTSEREQWKTQMSPMASAANNSSSTSRIYRPENYRSETYDFSTENEQELSHVQMTDNNQILSFDNMPSFGHDYFLNHWTLGRVKRFLEMEIPVENQLCLNICIDQCETQQLIDEQINKYLSRRSKTAPSNIRIELIKIYDNVEIAFPSRAIRLYDNDYLLLAILCSYSECAYIRTKAGWAYTDEESDRGESIIIDEISQMIDDINTDIPYKSEQCLHVLKNASFLYYKLIE
ncbi:hypothetical protein I4U23_006894 [Adineta vaga]|nr:hypothetical protein I4U23_006894 [Adineta vaga]